MSTPLYISRNYTEIGPFTPLEISDFIKRGILRSGDHLRSHGEDQWIELDAWSLPAEAAVVDAEKIVPSSGIVASNSEIAVVKPATRKSAKKAASTSTASATKKVPAKKATKKAAKDI